MQSLYEVHKILTYPRTDSRYLTEDIVPTLRERLQACGIGEYSRMAFAAGRQLSKLDGHIVDNDKVSDHHAHFDHFDPHILEYAGKTTKYFFSSDTRQASGAAGFPAAKTVYLKTYDSYEDERIRITTFDSTDLGTSFLVEKDGWRIFHAGDFNWWHWKGDTEENIKLARNGFKKQMKRLDGLAADVAFFPVDGRLEEFAALGAREFCARTHDHKKCCGW